MRRALTTYLLACLATSLGGCKILAGLPAKRVPNEVIVLGTEHEKHLVNQVYTLERFEEILRAVDPAVVLCEIPPDRFGVAWQEYLRTGAVTEERVKLYPEFTRALFPIALEGRLRIVPCSAWTKTMNTRRAAQLAQWRTTRIEDTRLVDEAQAKARRQLEQEGLDQDPLAMHSARFDEIVAAGMEPYERLFGRDLGEGGWKQINEGHYALISEALDEIGGEGKRVLVVFGAWHGYRLRELLAGREDIVLRRLGEVLR
jgi:hypothetical protein